MKITDVFVIPEDVELTAVAALPDDMRQRLQADPTDFVLTRARGRTNSKIINTKVAALVQGFAYGKTIVDAVLDYCRDNNSNPEATLEAAFPVLDELIQANFLAVKDSHESAPVLASLQQGDTWKGLVVLRSVQVVEDCEVYQARSTTGELVALKKSRSSAHAGRLSRLLAREAKMLQIITGGFTPQLRDHGEAEGCPYLVTEWRAGVNATRTATRLRAIHGTAGRRKLLDLCTALADTYADLHTQGVIHGDVHPGNVLISGSHDITLVDFGVARYIGSDDPMLSAPSRAVTDYFYEPEYAAAQLDGSPDAVLASYLGEQHGLAHLIYRLITGHGYAEFSAVRDASLRQLAESDPEPFSRWGLPDWPDAESVLRQALSRDPADRHDSVRDFATGLRSAQIPEPAQPAEKHIPGLKLSSGDWLLTDYLSRIDPEAKLFETGVLQPPYASITFGGGGIAYFLYRLASIREDARLLSWAKFWIEKTIEEASTVGELAFTNPAVGITRDVVGEVALYHTVTGLHAVRALISHAMNDDFSRSEALSQFVTAAEHPCDNIDLTLGKSGVLVGAALLNHAMPGHSELERLGTRLRDEILAELAEMPALAQDDQLCLTGIAHGWAGVLYAVLEWCRTQPSSLPDGLADRLEQLADCASPCADGVFWERKIRPTWQRDPTDFQAGWCNGTAGMIHLWTSAHKTFGDARFLQLAEGAARHVISTPEDVCQICCGLPGQAYGLLNIYKHTGERHWYDHACTLARHSLHLSGLPSNAATPPRHYALYKGSLGTALLCADLDAPTEACMPMFESEGWTRSALGHEAYPGRSNSQQD
jgi:eukaryotic-like serine/threonine-protein kinase